MTIVDLISTEAAGERQRLLAMASLAGAANALVLALVTLAAAAPDGVDLRLFAMFVLAIALFVLGARHTYHRAINIIQMALHRMRLRIVAKIERTEFQRMERIGTAEIMDRLTENMSVVSDAASMIAHLLQSLCILIFATLYLAWNSSPAFAMVALLITAGMMIFVSKNSEVTVYLRQTAHVRLTFFDLISDLLKGFKEIKFSQRRGREVREDIGGASELLRTSTAKANLLFEDNLIFATCNLFVALGALVFVLPRHVAIDPTTLGTLVAALHRADHEAWVEETSEAVAMGFEEQPLRCSASAAQIALISR